ncbi:type I 3-dehydroquinate dehydratase [Bacillus sp. Marseille-P3661]|uniref:type I 3-dehydroquinate dehydratase n=1 Tax=Bacillus sp. Marseille-P3661 TaxID=1936234 RepID=UPI000C818124|nr:type I 3-dehydroquinate dehydratase [Bacillus sp. Marseille-P3661]
MSTLTIKNLTIGKGIPKVIVPLVGKTASDLFEEAKIVNDLNPDVVEWRVDTYEHVEDLDAVQITLKKIRNILTKTLILFTFRTHKEGGNKEISHAYYTQLNEMAISTQNIDLVDVELFNTEEIVTKLVATAKEHGVFVIMSNHDFAKTPPKEEIVSRLIKMHEYGAHIPKIAVMPTSVADVLTLLDATNSMKLKYPDVPIITMSMGGTGVISRLAGELFGSAFTFGAGKAASAPGQIPAADLRTVLEIFHKSM